MLGDIATLTGAQVISDELGYDLKDTELYMLGNAASVKVTKEATTIVGGAGFKEAIDERINQIRYMIDQTTSDFDMRKTSGKISKTCWWCCSC